MINRKRDGNVWTFSILGKSCRLSLSGLEAAEPLSEEDWLRVKDAFHDWDDANPGQLESLLRGLRESP